jgi:hypothetical protein
MPARRMTKADRAERDGELLDILAEQSDNGREWCAADTVAAIYSRRHEHGRDSLSSSGVGRILARLATEGCCERNDAGYMSYYRRTL